MEAAVINALAEVLRSYSVGIAQNFKVKNQQKCRFLSNLPQIRESTLMTNLAIWWKIPLKISYGVL
jgi:hypothetical protein